jgi:hypothetical protein
LAPLERPADAGRHHHPDQEEEQDHQPVVDQMLQRVLELNRTELDTDLSLPEGLVVVGQRRVGEGQSGQRCKQQHDPSRRFHMHEACQGPHDPFDRLFGRQTLGIKRFHESEFDLELMTDRKLDFRRQG